MQILFVTPYLSWPCDHGGRIRSFQLLRGLAERHRVVNVTGLSERDAADDVLELARHGLDVRGAPLQPSFGKLGWGARARKAVSLLAGGTSLVTRFRDARMADLVREAAATADIAVLDHVWMAAYLPELGPLPFVLSTHNVESAVLKQKAALASGPGAWATRREARGLARLEGRVAETARCVVAVSDTDRDRLRRLAPRARVETVPNGVSLDHLTLLPAPSFEPLRLLYAGGMDYEPNVVAARRLAREILPHVRQARPGAEAWLVGHDPAGRLSDLQGEPGVHLLGRVDAMPPVLRQVSVVTVPLEMGGGSRLKILEAFAAGRPVVTTPRGAEGLDVTPGTQALFGKDAKELAAAVLEVAGDPELAARLITAGRRLVVEHHDWNVLRTRFRALLESAASL